MSIRTFVMILAATAILQAQPSSGRGPGEGRGGLGQGFIGMPQLVGPELGMPGRVVKNAPYSAEIVSETSQTLADGNRIRRTNNSRIYRDSEGRTRREQTLDLRELDASPNPRSRVFISDPVGGVDYTLNPAEKTASKVMRPQPRGGRGPGFGPRAEGASPIARKPADNPNLKTESLGRQLIEGVPADGTRTTLTIPAGQIGNDNQIQVVRETWYSPELQTTVLSKSSDPRSGETVFRLTNITRAEPPRTLFDVPVDYKISDMRRGRGTFRQ